MELSFHTLATPSVRADNDFGVCSIPVYGLIISMYAYAFEFSWEKSYGGPCLRIVAVRIGTGFWKLPECMHLPVAAWLIHRAAQVGLSAL